MVKDAAFVLVVMQLRAIRAVTFSCQKKNLSGRQHARGWRNEVDPKSVPVAGKDCGAERPRGIRTHTRYGRLEGYIDRSQNGGDVPRSSRSCRARATDYAPFSLAEDRECCNIDAAAVFAGT